ncbi:MAG: hypothetical protein PHU62_10015 [Bacteroidales bacterium]|nr:hypothetical protein [Bacteroidales bacterium]MDD2205635.1 hypothetical protein [Bacteroidales bacterium]MDD3152218.1 hypothetical protein [Bacteroidales bacterium]MDD3915097.1 hypothetical protein [Bacteroidales bacterium]MDD4634885.1 hypothetical protein [Bacteroidales bacterium]
MKKTKFNITLLIALISIAVVSICISIYYAYTSKQDNIIYEVYKDDMNYIIEASTFEVMKENIFSEYFSNFAKNDIKGFENIKNDFSIIEKDSTLYLKLKNCKTYLVTYTESDYWIVLIKTNSKISVPIHGVTGTIKESYSYFASKKIEKKIIPDFEAYQIVEAQLKTQSNTSVFHILEIQKNKEQTNYIGHDIYFSDSTIEVISLYTPALNNKNINKNLSHLITSLASKSKSYDCYEENDKTVSKLIITSGIKDAPIIVDDKALPTEHSNKEVDKKEEAVVAKLPEIKIDPQAFFSISMPITKGPFYVSNHNDKRGNIILQDKNNIVYFLTADGKKKWQFNADAQILGGITEIDLYGNNKVQYLFNTKSRLYLFDINGNHVKTFPVILPVQAKNQIVIKASSPYNFSIIYYGADNNTYFLSCNNGDIRLISKIDNTLPPNGDHAIQLISDKKNSYLIVKTNTNSFDFYNLNGTKSFSIDEKFNCNPNSWFYINNINSKSTFITNDNEGKLAYINKNKATQYTEFSTFGSGNYFYYIDITKDNSEDFIFVDNSKIIAYNKFRKEIFSNNLDIKNISDICCCQDKNNTYVIIFDNKECKADLIKYNCSNNKVSKATYSTSTMPAIINDNCIITEDNNVYIK